MYLNIVIKPDKRLPLFFGHDKASGFEPIDPKSLPKNPPPEIPRKRPPKSIKLPKIPGINQESELKK